MMTQDQDGADLYTLTAEIVASYVAHNELGAEALAGLIGSTYQALKSAGEPAPVTEETPKPDKAAIKRSLSPDHLTSFLDGRRYKSLKRHLTTAGLSPDAYRQRFGLPSDYPMVAPAYSAQRSELARTLGLGRKAAKPSAPSEAEEAADDELAAATKPAPGPGRRKAAAT